MACWDILGKAPGLPVCTLLGGRYGEDFVLYRAISQESPAQMAAQVAGYRAEGYRRFQLKVGGDPDDGHRAHPRRAREAASRATVLVADANTGWLMHDAARVVRAVRDVDVYIEQPCLTLRGVPGGPPAHRPPVRPRRGDRLGRRAAARPRRPGDGRGQPQDQQARRPHQGPAGPRPVRVARHRHDASRTRWGGDITTAAIAHLAHSTPEEFLFTATDFNSYVTVSTAEGAPRRQDGRMAASTDPGLGVKPRMRALGKPVLEVTAPRKRR